MKKYFSNKQIAIAVIIFTLIVIVMFSLSFGMPLVANAYSEDFDVEEIYYAASSSAQTETESFSYATKTIESYSINTSFPNYYNTNYDLLNTCANVAGANIIGYYDRYFDELIPDYTTGRLSSNKFTYYPMTYYSEKKQTVINDLYQRMQTNANGAGNTQTQYKNGLASYVQSKSLSIAFNNVITNGSLDLTKLKVQLQNGNPISLYLSGYNFTKITDNGSEVTLQKNLFDDNHIAIAYGYEKVSYLDASGKTIKTELYLKVSTGLNGITGVYIVNKYGKLNDAEAAYIY